MYTEKEFLDFIEYTTGKKLGEDFGFILGTHSPYPSSYISSAEPTEGFMCWRKEGNLNARLRVRPGTQEEYLKTIIEFLLTDIKKEHEEAMSKVEFYGEFDSPNK